MGAMKHLLCPACQEKMRPVEIGTITIDECRFCDGLWLDRDEPEQLAKMDILGQHLLQPMTFDDSRKVKKDGERVCPRCEDQLREYRHNDVTVDICPKCRGMFLDRGELQEPFK